MAGRVRGFFVTFTLSATILNPAIHISHPLTMAPASQRLLRHALVLSRSRRAILGSNRRNGMLYNCFSTSASRSIMEMAGFTDTQLMVREAVSQVCSQFPNTYWQEHDQNEQDPKEFHAALAKDGWLGVALPEELGGSGLGRSIPWSFHISRISRPQANYVCLHRNFRGCDDDANYHPVWCGNGGSPSNSC